MRKHLLLTLIASFLIQLIGASAADNHSLQVRYLTFKDGRLIAIPEKFILEETQNNGTKSIVLEGDYTFSYNQNEISSESYNYTATHPGLISFKFTNADNDQVFKDVDANILMDTEGVVKVSADVPVIGKRLRPSFVLSDGAELWLEGEKQISGVSSLRFEDVVTYIIAYKNHLIYDVCKSETENDEEITNAGFKPFGRTCQVDINYLTDIAIGVQRIPAIYLTFGDGETWSSSQWIGQTLPDGSNTKENWIKDCTFRLDGAGVWPDIDTVEGCEIRGRGNSSWDFNYKSKNPYRIKFPKKAKQAPFNLTEDRQWVLIANKKDGSMTTNSIAQKIASMIDAEALCHMIPVDLYINGHYRGSYCFTEKIGISDNSVAIDEKTGCLLELDSYYDEDYKFRDDNYDLPVNVKDPDFTEEDDERIVTFDDVKNSFNRFTSALKSGGDITEHMDMNAWAKFWLVNDLVNNRETNHPKSCYLFNPNPVSGERWTFGPAWDFDWACGYWTTYFVSFVTTPLNGCAFFKELKNTQAAKRAYYKEWVNFMQQGRLQELIEYIDDYTKFAMLGFTHNNDADINEKNTCDYNEIAELSKTWITTRANFIFNSLEEFNISEVELTDGEVYENTIEKEIGTLIYTRTLPNLLWNPLYVPFKIPYEALEENYEVAYINAMHSYDNDENGEIDEMVMEIVKIKAGTLKPNHPYLIKAKNEEAMEMSIVQENATLYPADITTLDCSSVYTKFEITGTYQEMTSEDLNGSLVISTDGSWKKLSSSSTLKPFRFYLTISSREGSPVEISEEAMSSVRISVRGEFGNATGVDEVNAENGKQKSEIYDLSGRRVNAPAKGGVYIINGKKMIY